MEQIDNLIVGAGVCGLLTALKYKRNKPDADIIVVDAEPYCGHHSTTRNSGVLHAGIYYPTGSMKHRMCIEGRDQWDLIAKELDIGISICGKYVVAASDKDLPTLEKYKNQAIKNGVPGIQEMTPEQVQEIAEYVNVAGGFFSPNTGILDISEGVNKLRDAAESLGVTILMNTPIDDLQVEAGRIVISMGGESLAVKNFINCAGLGSIKLRQQLGLVDIESKIVKGNYVVLSKPYYSTRLIYPVPPADLSGLGVHTSFHMDRRVRFGPDREPAKHENDYEVRDEHVDKMYPAITKLFKKIDKSELAPDYSGLRTKILRNGELYTDFLVQGPNETGTPGYFEALGIESPGLTAAPAIADSLIERLN